MTRGIIHPWAEKHVPDQSGKTFVITGANSGIGYAAAQALACKGARVIMACRNATKAEQARASILENAPDAEIDIVSLDLADLNSVAECASTINSRYDRLDCLINNAGLGWIDRAETVDGFEMHIGANHLGHFALTSQLLGLLKSTPHSRVVSIASLAHYWGRIKFEDLQLTQGYNRAVGYGQSKLANLMFGLELQRFFERNQLDITSIVVHPGMSGTNIANAALEAEDRKWLSRITSALTPFVTQSPEMGCLPTLYAATSSQVKGGEYIGPKYAFEMFGKPAKARIAKHAAKAASAQQLWRVSEALTQVDYQQAIA